MIEQYKECIKCFIDRPTSEFYKDSSRKNGLAPYCKSCVQTHQTQYYLDNKEEISKRAKKKREIPENKEKIVKYKKEYYTKYPWKMTLCNIKKRCGNPNDPSFNNYGGRGIECRITEDKLRELWYRDKAYEMKRPTIDRINNDGHYEYWNCRYIEKSLNSKKDKYKPVLQYDLDGNFIREWTSVKEAKTKTHINHIDMCCRYERKTAGGYKWRYKNEI